MTDCDQIQVRVLDIAMFVQEIPGIVYCLRRCSLSPYRVRDWLVAVYLHHFFSRSVWGRISNKMRIHADNEEQMKKGQNPTTWPNKNKLRNVEQKRGPKHTTKEAEIDFQSRSIDIHQSPSMQMEM